MLARAVTLRPWLAGVVVAVGLDAGIQYAWAPDVAAFVKARHGWWFSDAVPSEGPRKVARLATGTAEISADGVRFLSTGARLEATALLGTTRWQTAVTGQTVVLPDAAGAAYVVDSGRLRAIDGSGHVRWSVITNDKPETMGDAWAPYQYRWDLARLVHDPRGGLCASGREAVWCFNADGTIRWRWAARDGDGVTGVVAGPDARLYASLYNAVVLLSADGTEQSRVLGLRAIGFDRHTGLLLAAGTQRAVWMQADGSIVGEAEVSDGPFGLAVDPRAGTIYVSDGSLRAFATNGRQLWRFAPRDYLRSEVAIDINGDALVAGRRRLFAVRPDGAVRWLATLDQPSHDPLRVVAARPEGVYVAANPQGPVTLLVER